MAKNKKCPKCRTIDIEKCHSMFCPMRKEKKGTWGGKRERKTKAEATKVIRVPVSKLDAVYELINGKITTPHKMP